jgi:chromosome segregation ATPase
MTEAKNYNPASLNAEGSTHELANVSNPESDANQNLSEKNESDSTQSQSNEIDWHKLAHKLREHNRKLLKKVFKLEQELAEVTNIVQQQNQRSQNTDTLIAQQAKELNQNQEEIANLIAQIETLQQEEQNQALLNENLSKQLQASQQQIAQLERECALIQENYNNKTHELLAKEQLAQELDARLHRQQRYTLQYKTALDRYIEYANSSATDSAPTNSIKANNQPIQAWSERSRREAKEHPLTSLKSTEPSNVTPFKHPNSSESNQPPFKETNWPSPVINTVNTEKKPKSLAAVELPKFPRQSS